MVDRVLFIPDKLNTLDGYRLLFSSITLRNILSCKGATSSNPSHHRRAPEASENIFGQAGGSLVSPAIDGSARGGATARSETIQSAKRLHAKSLANEVNNMLVEQTDGYAAADPGHVRPRSRLCGSPP